MNGPASVGVIVTMPPEWANQLRVELTCPHCFGETRVARGAGAFSDLALWLNEHLCACRALFRQP